MDPTRYRRRSRRSHARRPLGAAHAAVQPPLEAARTSPKTNPSPRYAHQSARITKPSSSAFPTNVLTGQNVLRKLGHTGDRCLGSRPRARGGSTSVAAAGWQQRCCRGGCCWRAAACGRTWHALDSRDAAAAVVHPPAGSDGTC
jgi:hypothetical protein